MVTLTGFSTLGKREAKSGVSFLQQLFANPVATNSTVVDTIKFSRAGAAKLIERFVDLGILKPLDENARYGKTYIYWKYVSVFTDEK